jgi:hypothetical protein
MYIKMKKIGFRERCFLNRPRSRVPATEVSTGIPVLDFRGKWDRKIRFWGGGGGGSSFLPYTSILLSVCFSHENRSMFK